MTWLLVAAGGAAGSLARFAAAEALKPRTGPGFPWHTFAVNVAGCFVLGWLAACCRDRPPVYVLLGTGFCGGFTTFSTFALEAVELLAAGRPAAAAGYVSASVAAGLLGAWAGLRGV